MRRRVLLCMTLISMSACRGDDATRPNLDPASPPSQSISDGNHLGNPEFFFLPPLVKDPSGSADWSPGTFNGSLAPTVDICELDALTDAQVAKTTPCKSGGYASKYQLTSANVSLTDEHYHINWGVPSSAAIFFRISASVGSVSLGFVDLKTGTSSELKNVNTGELVPMKDGRTLPIKFRIEKNALCYTPGDPTKKCTSKSVDFAEGGTVTNDDPEPSGIEVPAQPGGTKHTITLADCVNLNPRATDLPIFDDCLGVKVDPALTAPLTNAAKVFNCAVSGTVGDVFGTGQARRLAMLQLNEQGTQRKVKALPHVDPPCPAPTASVTPSFRDVYFAFTHGGVKTAAKQMLAVLAPKPLYAARFIDLGGGGSTYLEGDAIGEGANSRSSAGGARFSLSAASPATTNRDFQLALPAKFEVSATPTDRSEQAGSTITVSVKVTDLGGDAVRNAQVRFQPSAGSSVHPAVIATGIDGLATVQWTLSDAAGENTLVASGEGIAGPDVNGPREGTDPFQPLNRAWGDLTNATEGFVVSTGSMTVTATGRVQAVAGTVLIYGAAFGTARFKQEAISLGYTVTEFTNAQWASATQADFASYDVIVVPSMGNGFAVSTLTSTKGVWGAAIANGNMAMAGLDADAAAHFDDATDEGAHKLLDNLLAWAAAGRTTGFVSMVDCSNTYSWAPTIGPFVGLTAVGGCAVAEDVNITNASHPVMAGLDDAQLSGWNASIHTYFPTIGGFSVVATIGGTGSLAGQAAILVKAGSP